MLSASPAVCACRGPPNSVSYERGASVFPSTTPARLSTVTLVLSANPAVAACRRYIFLTVKLSVLTKMPDFWRVGSAGEHADAVC